MAAIKRFFEKRKLDVKFKTAGSGHKLTEDTRQRDEKLKRQHSEGRDYAPSKASQHAGAAALNRIDHAYSSKGAAVGTSASAVKAQVRQEFQAERAATAKAHKLAEVYSAPKEVEFDGAPMLAVEGVFFKCPLAGPEVLPKKDMEDYIKNFLYSQLAEEPEMTTALMIHTFNRDPDRVKVCVETLCKYIDNILSNPSETKYHKIRVNNKAFQERVYQLEGTHEFLQAAGFMNRKCPGPNSGEPEDFLVMDEENAANLERLRSLKEVLLAAEPIRPELDRNLKVFHAAGNPSRMEVPSEFYNISPDEIRREQQARNEAVERLGMLRTKEMREREHQRELRRYRYCLIRVRFPDGVVLQATFRALDKLNIVFDFIREHLELDWIPFAVSVMGGSKLEESSLGESLAELQLAPATLLHFNYDAAVMAEVTAQQGGMQIKHYLKSPLLTQPKAL